MAEKENLFTKKLSDMEDNCRNLRSIIEKNKDKLTVDRIEDIIEESIINEANEKLIIYLSKKYFRIS